MMVTQLDMELLRRLSQADGPPGAEGPVRDILREVLRERVDELRTDTMGNLFAVKRATTPVGASRPPRVMLTAHMDEPALMIVLVDSNGRLRFQAAGRVEARADWAGGAHRVGRLAGGHRRHAVSPDIARRPQEYPGHG
ncbi:MAG: hypothetical protein U0641_13595 [Anaerolineae bacterium]